MELLGMTTQARSHLPDHGIPDEFETASLEAALTEPVADAFRLLDHRTRERAISGPLPRAGHYLAVEGGGETRYVRLDANVTHIGRGIASDVRLEDQRVSRNHAVVV